MCNENITMSREVERRGLTAVSGAASVVVWVVTAPDAPHALVTVVVTVGIFVDPGALWILLPCAP